jgi:hypothetical protein
MYHCKLFIYIKSYKDEQDFDPRPQVFQISMAYEPYIAQECLDQLNDYQLSKKDSLGIVRYHHHHHHHHDHHHHHHNCPNAKVYFKVHL